MNALLIGLALAASAAATPPASDPSAALERAAACRALADTTARAACYDAAIDALKTAEARGELVVMDAAKAQAVDRQNFGLAKPAPAAPLPARAEPVERVSLTVSRAWRAPDGDWMMAMTDGQVWRQIDGRFPHAPRQGSTAEIRRAWLGSYLLNIDGQTAVRARREE